MQSLRETGKHIKSVAETRKITNAATARTTATMTTFWTMPM